MSDKNPAASFQDLAVWRKSHALTLNIYTVTATFPKSELFGLISQMRRAATSVPANIAEGFKRRGMLSAYERTILASVRASTLRTALLTSMFCILYSVF